MKDALVIVHADKRYMDEARNAHKYLKAAIEREVEACLDDRRPVFFLNADPMPIPS